MAKGADEKKKAGGDNASGKSQRIGRKLLTGYLRQRKSRRPYKNRDKCVNVELEFVVHRYIHHLILSWITKIIPHEAWHLKRKTIKDSFEKRELFCYNIPIACRLKPQTAMSHALLLPVQEEEGVLKKMDSSRFAKGEYVVYGTNGICLIEDIRLMKFALDTEKSDYYILKPASNDASTIYVPMKNEKLVGKMRSIMTKDEIDSLLLGMRDKEIQWEKDRRYRSEIFHEILVKGVTQKLLLMIRCIYMKKRELLPLGKKLPTTDENTLKAAEKLVEEEFAYSLEIPRTDVGKYIRRLLDVPETEED